MTGIEAGASMAHARAQLALRLLDHLEREHVPYCVLGDHRALAVQLETDLDLMVDPARLAGIAQVLAGFAAACAMHLVQCLRHEVCAYYYVLAGRDNGGKLLYLHPDICGDFVRRGRRFLGAAEVLAGRVRAVSPSGLDEGYWVPAPEYATLYYLMKRIDKASISNEQLGYITEQWSRRPEDALKQAARFWWGGPLQSLIDAVQASDARALHSVLPELRRQLDESVSGFVARTNELRRVVSRVRQPTGYWIALLGPDGSGKSTLLRELGRSLGPAFRRTAVYHLRPGLAAREDRVEANPHGRPPRGFLLSLLKLFYYVAGTGWGYARFAWPQLRASTLVLLDRYFHDLLVDARRYRFGGPPWLAAAAGRLVPKPDLFLVLDCAPESAQSRKREVSEAESARQREGYLRFARANRRVQVIDASLALEDVVRNAEDVILCALAERARRRLLRLDGKPSPWSSAAVAARKDDADD